MPSLNRITISGNLAADPEVRVLPSQSTVANLRVACNESYKDKNTGEVQTRTEWFDVELWNGTAQFAQQNLKKGDPVFVEGSIRTDSWDDNGTTRTRMKVRGRVVFKLARGNRPAQDNATSQHQQQRPPQPAQGGNGRDGGNGRQAPSGGGHDGGNHSGDGSYNGGAAWDDDIPF